MKIGILAIQGSFAKHQEAIKKLGLESVLVRTKEELAACEGLIIPGGESTTLSIMLQKHHLWQHIAEFGGEKAVFGTCAGLIILAKHVPGHPFRALGLIDITVQRNAYGRQVDSFIDDLDVRLNGIKDKFSGVFIRAPKIIEIGADVTPLAWHGRDVVVAENSRILVATFHPELTDDLRLHEYFLRKIK